MFCEKRIVRYALGYDNSGYATCRRGSDGKWYSDGGFFACREGFASVFRKNTPMILFRHPGAQGRNIAAFIAAVEKRLGLKQRSKFGTTQRQSITWIEPVLFWKASAMRRSLSSAA